MKKIIILGIVSMFLLVNFTVITAKTVETVQPQLQHVSSDIDSDPIYNNPMPSENPEPGLEETIINASNEDTHKGSSFRYDETVVTTGQNGPLSPEATANLQHGVLPTTDTVILQNVPDLVWYNGCTPTAVAMILGYWDNLYGTNFLYQGTYLSIASWEHFVDYGYGQNGEFCDSISCGCFDCEGCPAIPDRSELGGAHGSNCIADFIRTSQSIYGLRYGATHTTTADFTWQIRQYAFFTGYNIQVNGYQTGEFMDFVEEIDAGRPVLITVDFTGDGVLDHSSVVVGYNSEDEMLGVYTTASEGVVWIDIHSPEEGNPWGIGQYFTISEPDIALFAHFSYCSDYILHVEVDASSSRGACAYSWDFDDDGVFEVSGITASHTYSTPGWYPITLRATNLAGDEEFYTALVNIQDDISVTVDSPNGGEFWKQGEDRVIYWSTTGNIISVDNEFWRLDDQGNPVEKTAWENAYPNDGYSYWNLDINHFPAGNYKLKVKDHYSQYYDWSDEYFTIGALQTNVVVTSPVSMEEWTRGNTYNIEWELYEPATIALIRIKLIDEWGGEQTIIESTDVFSGSCPWTITQYAGYYQIKIEDIYSWPEQYWYGPVFRIVNVPPPPLTMLSPNGGEQIVYNSEIEVKWNCGVSTIPKVVLVLKNFDSGQASYYYPATNVQGENRYTFQIGNHWPGSNFKMEVYDKAHETTVYDWSDSPFSLVYPNSVTFTAPDPDGTTQWRRNPLIGKPIYNEITYTYTGVIDPCFLGIYLIYPTGQEVGLEGSLGGGGGSGWVKVSFDHNTPTGEGYKIKLIFGLDIYTAISPTFSIIAAGDLDLYVISPNLYSYYQIGSTVALKWAATFSGNLKIELVQGADNFPITTIASSTANNKGGSYSWKIPATIKPGQYKIKITDTKNPLLTDTSDFYFQLGI